MDTPIYIDTYRMQKFAKKLTDEQFGCFTQLLFLSYSSRKTNLIVSDADLRHLINCSEDDWIRLYPAVIKFFYRDESRLLKLRPEFSNMISGEPK